jgi:hypothetical protein
VGQLLEDTIGVLHRRFGKINVYEMIRRLTLNRGDAVSAVYVEASFHVLFVWELRLVNFA